MTNMNWTKGTTAMNWERTEIMTARRKTMTVRRRSNNKDVWTIM